MRAIPDRGVWLPWAWNKGIAVFKDLKGPYSSAYEGVRGALCQFRGAWVFRVQLLETEQYLSGILSGHGGLESACRWLSRVIRKVSI